MSLPGYAARSVAGSRSSSRGAQRRPERHPRVVDRRSQVPRDTRACRGALDHPEIRVRRRLAVERARGPEIGPPPVGREVGIPVPPLAAARERQRQGLAPPALPAPGLDRAGVRPDVHDLPAVGRRPRAEAPRLPDRAGFESGGDETFRHEHGCADRRQRDRASPDPRAIPQTDPVRSPPGSDRSSAPRHREAQRTESCAGREPPDRAHGDVLTRRSAA